MTITIVDKGCDVVGGISMKICRYYMHLFGIGIGFLKSNNNNTKNVKKWLEKPRFQLAEHI
jgi:hypothetical protein